VINAFKESKENNLIGPIFKSCQEYIKKINKIVNRTTNFKKGFVSVERTACNLIKNRFEKNKKIGIIGTGSAGSLITKILKEYGFTNVFLCNRNKKKSVKLSKKYGFQIWDFKKYKYLVKKCEIIFFTTSSQKILLSEEDSFFLSNENKMIIDLGNPFNVCEKIKKLKNVELITLDFIKNINEKNLQLRKKFIPEINKIISVETSNLYKKIESELLSKRIGNNFLKFKLPNKNILKFRNKVLFYIREYLSSKGFIEVETPYVVIVSTDPAVNEPENELFKVNWYGKQLFLRQSVQLHKQMLISKGFDKIFEIGPFWRAEEEKSKRHLDEACGLDVEMSRISSHNDIMILLENMISFVIDKINKEDKKLLEELNLKIETPKIPFIRITYDEAVNLLKKNKIPVEYGKDLGVYNEKKLFDILKNRFNRNFFFIEKYPATVKKFYTKKEKNNLTRTFDLLYKSWELASGAQRETNYEKILTYMNKNNLSTNKYKFYLQIFKKDMPSHGGFGLGIDRFVARLLNIDDLTKIKLFPRTKTNIIP